MQIVAASEKNIAAKQGTETAKQDKSAQSGQFAEMFDASREQAPNQAQKGEVSAQQQDSMQSLDKSEQHIDGAEQSSDVKATKSETHTTDDAEAVSTNQQAGSTDKSASNKSSTDDAQEDGVNEVLHDWLSLLDQAHQHQQQLGDFDCHESLQESDAQFVSLTLSDGREVALTEQEVDQVIAALLSKLTGQPASSETDVNADVNAASDDKLVITLDSDNPDLQFLELNADEQAMLLEQWQQQSAASASALSADWQSLAKLFNELLNVQDDPQSSLEQDDQIQQWLATIEMQAQGESVTPEALQQALAGLTQALPAEDKQALLQWMSSPQLTDAIEPVRASENSEEAIALLLKRPTPNHDRQLAALIQQVAPNVTAEQSKEMVNQWRQQSVSLPEGTNQSEVFVQFVQQQSGQTDVSLSTMSEAMASLSDRLANVSELSHQLQQISQHSAAASQTHQARQASVQPQQALAGDVQRQAEQSQASKAEQLATALHKAEGAKTLVNQVQMMVNQRMMTADIRLDPPELGSMQVRVQMQGEQASVSFVVQNQAAKDALDQSQNRLRDMLQERGIELGQSSVRQDKGQQGNAQGESGQSDQFAGQNGTSSQGGQSDENSEQSVAVQVTDPSAIDYFV